MWSTSSAQTLKSEADKLKSTHLRELLKDEGRNNRLLLKEDSLDVVLDLARQRVAPSTVDALLKLAEECKLKEKIDGMFGGKIMNPTEKRAVLHVALRGASSDKFEVDGENVIPKIHDVLQNIKTFSEKVRSGKFVGYTGKALTQVVCIGIGGSYLGPESVVEAMKTYPDTMKSSAGRTLRFLANVDPIDVERALHGLTPETTLVIVVSKTFTTAETMLNARTVKKWLLDSLKDEKAIGNHMAAVSTNIPATTEFGINKENVFGFWDWVGGRYSVCSAVGALPIALHFGYDAFQQFLDGCRQMDVHFKSTPLEKNLPVMMGLTALWNASFMEFSACAVLPYCQALHRFPAHVQQVMMESNGKRVDVDGKRLAADAGEIFFGEPGTNGQHSFYQLMHQGRIVPADFIGFRKSQTPHELPGEPVSNHDELMSNFFAQPDALALGKTEAECKAEGVPDNMVPHKTFPGNRPSSVLMMPICSPFYVGVLMSLYENRTAVQGFMWNLNPFDQFGVQLGKVLATDIRGYLSNKRKHQNDDALVKAEKAMLEPTKRMLMEYLK